MPVYYTDHVVAFVDIGTNSIRLLLVRIDPVGTYTTISLQKETVRLGEAEFTSGYLQEAAMERAVLVCKHFADMARANKADRIIAVATSATREAKNKKIFIRKLKKEAGLDVNTISGIEEARIIYSGIVNGIHLNKKTALFVDIGGGSTEVVIGNQDNYLFLNSLKLGAIRLGSLFPECMESMPISKETYGRMRQYVYNSSVRTIQKLSNFSVDILYGSSGTIEHLAESAVFLEHGRTLDREESVSYQSISRTIDHLCSLTLEERGMVPGIGQKRADIIIPGAAIIDMIMQELNIGHLKITDRGLREGLLIDYLARSEHANVINEGSIRYRSVYQLARRCNVDEVHGETVAQLSLQMFDSSKDLGLHDFGWDARELLEYASILHDAGIFLSYSNHQDHSYYLIRNTDLLGFDQTEIMIMSALGYFHRKYYPSNKHKEFRQLDKRSQIIVRKLAILIRIAESLDRSHKASVASAKFALRENKLILDLHCADDCQLELWGVQSHLDVFKKAFKRKLNINLIS